MGLMDKVKAQASSVAARAQEAGKVGQAKLEAVQAKRRADSLLEELGKITFEAKVGRGAPGDTQRANELVEQLRQYEAEYGPVGAPPGSGPWSGGSSTDATGTPEPAGTTDPTGTTGGEGDARGSGDETDETPPQGTTGGEL